MPISYGYIEWKRNKEIRKQDKKTIKELVDQLKYLIGEMNMGCLELTKDEFEEIKRLIRVYE